VTSWTASTPTARCARDGAGRPDVTLYFALQFRAAYGETPYRYQMTRRIERAKALLRRGDRTVTKACMEVGCTSLGSFSVHGGEATAHSQKPLNRARGTSSL